MQYLGILKTFMRYPRVFFICFSSIFDLRLYELYKKKRFFLKFIEILYSMLAYKCVYIKVYPYAYSTDVQVEIYMKKKT